MRFHDFFLVFFPVLMTENLNIEVRSQQCLTCSLYMNASYISSSEIPLTLGKGTLNRAAFSFRFCLIAEDSALAFFSLDLSKRYCGRASVLGSAGSEVLTFRSCTRISPIFHYVLP
jgi:hypothetical protein